MSSYKKVNPKNVFDPQNPNIKQSIIRMVIDYLDTEGYSTSAITLQDESNLKMVDDLRGKSRIKQLRSKILEGQWAEVEKMCLPRRGYKNLLYAVYVQQYLELIDKQEYQMAFTLLNNKLKRLESVAATTNEFADLCYLLTCKNVQDAPSFYYWDGVASSRERLVSQFSNILEFEESYNANSQRLPPNRLVELLQKSVTYQIESTSQRPQRNVYVTSLLEDYHCGVLPNTILEQWHAHTKNIKCIKFLGDSGALLASGSSDNSVRIWNSQTGKRVGTLSDYSSRIWEISSDRTAQYLATGSREGVKIWDMSAQPYSLKSHLASTVAGDLYTLQIAPLARHIVCGGYDKTVRLYDIETEKCLETLRGHAASVCSTRFNSHGNLLVSGSKDCTVRFWDIVSGVCINTFSSHLGEVTSVEVDSSGTHILTASKDNSNRLWDIRMSRPIQRFKGHQNTSKNFIRTSFGPNQTTVIGGSEDGCVYIWDCEEGSILQKLKGHGDVVYSAQWNSHQALLASCSDDRTICTWGYDESVEKK